jgi:hypothetical protein
MLLQQEGELGEASQLSWKAMVFQKSAEFYKEVLYGPTMARVTNLLAFQSRDLASISG